MKNNIELYGIIGFTLLLLGFATCEGVKCNQKNKDAHDAKEVVLVDSVKLTQNILTAQLKNKAEVDKIVSDTIKVLNERIKLQETNKTMLINHILDLRKMVGQLTKTQQSAKIDSIEEKDTTGTLVILVDAKSKDSILHRDSIIIANQRTEIAQDSLLNRECNITLNDCQNANKAKESLIEFEKPKHPAWHKFWGNVKKPFEVAEAALAIFGGYEIYKTVK